ncbi:hypothetical protein MKY87_19795 [Paenibacillus sp. FSL R7-0198]|uniref:hypothetical protein n=1 Tax=unclassified Paenibacillus TaxID=185978 RepID=UPI0030DBB9C1
MMSKKRIFIGTLVIILLLVVFVPKFISYWNDRNYYSNNMVTYFSLAEFSILDKYVEGDTYYLKLSIDSEYFDSKYKLKGKTKEYSLGKNIDLFNKIDLNNPIKYTGIQLESTVPLNKINQEEKSNLRRDPISVISKEEYDDFITIIDVY